MPKFKFKLREVEPVSKKDKLSWEKELLGLYVSAHPLEDHAEVLAKITKPIRSIATARGNINIGGVITKVQKILTKKGDQMAFLDLEDLTGPVEVLVFPTIFQKFRNLVEVEKIVVISGKVSDKDGVPKFLADDIKEIDEFINSIPRPEPTAPKIVTITIPGNASEEIFIQLKKLFEAYPGEQPVNLMINQQQVKTPFRVSMNVELKEKITQLLT
ncbi:MAG TPA: OB-fold nucleic acid binding domain-containing protein [Verrucomicrobiae bacterium]|nr:OB-fold nucleic acid binding domain-containing protein [Verrucomicrobiae bacterium]